MKICRLLLRNFRNYDQEEIIWHEKTNIIHGLNAQGKSNLLEAISYLSLASSFRGAKDWELIKWDKNFFYLEGDIKEKEEHTISVGYSDNKIKRWKVNGEKKQRLGEIIGFFHSVIFSPEDLNIIKNGPEYRRQFLNRQMVQLFPDFCNLLLTYNQILKQRNNVLKNNFNSNDFIDRLAPWDEQLATIGAKIIKRRYNTCQNLLPITKDYHKKLTNGEEIELIYDSFLPQKEIEQLSESEIRTAFLIKLKQIINLEKKRGISLCGPHRDDIEILINRFSTRKFASQGQQRSVALTLKLSELELAKTIRGAYPVLLLDDVMSELDKNRQEQLLKTINDDVQTFITATDLDFQYNDGIKFFINNGQVLIKN